METPVHSMTSGSSYARRASCPSGNSALGAALSQRRLAFSDMRDWLVPMGISLLALGILALFALALLGVPPGQLRAQEGG